MKNLIITFCNTSNYGAILQAYALQHILNQKNETYLLNYDLCKPKENKTLLRKFISSIINIIFKQKFKRFLRKNSLVTHKIDSIKLLEKEVVKYNNVICGSDQVWNIDITKKDSSIFMLDFDMPENINRFSYAASFGTKKISDTAKKKLKKVLPKYKKISVREESAKTILKEIGFENVDVVLDPTLLLEKQEWNKICKKNEIKEQYIFIYCLEDTLEFRKTVDYIANKLNLPIVDMCRKKRFKSKTINKPYIGPDEFVSLIKNAEFIITNSFHGTVFSILFEKNFITIEHTTRGTRQKNILKKLGLDDRLCSNVDKNKINKCLESTINYVDVNEKLSKERREALKFIDYIGEKKKDNE